MPVVGMLAVLNAHSVAFVNGLCIVYDLCIMQPHP